MSPLPRSFYLRSPLQVAKDLPGKVFVRKTGTETLRAMIVEVEAYHASNDPASHAYRGMTERNRNMFSIGGTLYVYFTYGMHFCANIVTGEAGKAGAVLIRAVEPLEGIATMRELRGPRIKDDRQLTNGPAKFCQAFAIARDENGMDFCGNEIYLTEGKTIPAREIVASSRIGIAAGVEKQWRFFVRGNKCVSRGN
ncbi:MAG: DNA-3-methyladenine glycosylase [Ignavibacteriales bacterium]|nr:DNA-3-methyladenine glycosylase [Ignavibacteriales bacterium]